MNGQQDSRGRSSVDGGEIAWEDESQFNDARRHAHRVWSRSGLNRVKFPADDALNKRYLGAGKPYGDTKSRHMIAAHELGHALGFCHKSPSAYRSLMAPNTFDMPSNGAPTPRDRKNYHALWG